MRAEEDENDDSMGLFSTTYVAKGLRFAATHTSATNAPLIRLYEKHQYTIVLRSAENKMIRLGKAL